MSARLFVAVDLPGDVRSALAEWGREAAGADLALRPVAIESLHVTLAFLGHRALDDVEPLARVVREAGGVPAELRVGEAIWLSPRRPSVLAAAIGDVSGDLGLLQQAVAAGAAGAVGWTPERRSFRPHVTGARVRRGYAPRRSGVPSPPAATFTARTMTLYRSHLGGRGPARYEPVERVALDAPVEIAAYDPTWPSAFEAERARLAPLLHGAEIHHIGSTAVPGLAAKPVIDVMALVDDLDAPLAGLVEAGGYAYPEAYNAGLSGRRWLCRPSAAHRTHHLHLVDDRAELARHLGFRDRLRADPELAASYAALKRDLAARSGDDREAYTAAKGDFVRSVEADDAVRG